MIYTPPRQNSNRSNASRSREDVENVLKDLQKRKLHYQLTGQYNLAEHTVYQIENVKKQVATKNAQKLQNDNAKRIRQVCMHAHIL